MAIKALKEFIFKNDKIEYVLESIGCHHIKYHPVKSYYSCGNYNGDNTSAINVYNDEYLNVVNWTRQMEFDNRSDIITLTQYNRQCSFIDAVKYLYNLLGLKFKPGKRDEKDDKKHHPCAKFRRIRSARHRVDVSDIEDINVIEDSVLDDYTPMLHIDWFKEGIAPWASDKFGICYSYKRNRVVIPHRYWLTGELLGMNMRTTVQDYEELGVSKYYLTPGMNKSINLYGLYENYESIQDAGYIILLEGEKSVLKMYSRDGHECCEWMGKYGFNGKACVALSGKCLSDEQVDILIGLNVEVIICLDKDVDINESRSLCERFYKSRRTSYIYDDFDMLKDKDSPADSSNETFSYLFKSRTRYTAKEHERYLKSLETK